MTVFRYLFLCLLWLFEHSFCEVVADVVVEGDGGRGAEAPGVEIQIDDAVFADHAVGDDV